MWCLQTLHEYNNNYERLVKAFYTCMKKCFIKKT